MVDARSNLPAAPGCGSSITPQLAQHLDHYRIPGPPNVAILDLDRNPDPAELARGGKKSKQLHAFRTNLRDDPPRQWRSSDRYRAGPPFHRPSPDDPIIAATTFRAACRPTPSRRVDRPAAHS
jgi:hypothetical protein